MVNRSPQQFATEKKRERHNLKPDHQQRRHARIRKQHDETENSREEKKQTAGRGFIQAPLAPRIMPIRQARAETQHQVKIGPGVIFINETRDEVRRRRRPPAEDFIGIQSALHETQERERDGIAGEHGD